jgi:ABC-type lipoprotein release transport system permease subunit
MVFLKIAWRNIWRNPRRSWVLMSAIGVGVFSFVLGISFMSGFAFEIISSTIDLQGGDIQIARAGYSANPTIRSTLNNSGEIERHLSGRDDLRFAPGISLPAMASSAEQATGIIIRGIVPSLEKDVTIISRSIVEGSYLSSREPNGEVFVGEELADRLKVTIGEKIVLTANDVNNDLSAGAYRIVGLYRTSSSEFDKATVFLPLGEARELVGFSDEISLITVRVDRTEDPDKVASELRAALGDDRIEILTWRQRFPMLEFYMEMFDFTILLLVVIMFIAVAFTIINSFLMVILERIHEFGIMMAGGVRPRGIRFMLYVEAAMMTVLGMSLGCVISLVAVLYFQTFGVDLSAFSEGLRAFGMSPIVYPILDIELVVKGFILIAIMVFIAILYPAFRASGYDVVEAINHV